MVGRHHEQRVTLVDLASHEFHDLVEVHRLCECQVGSVLVMGVIDPRALDEQHVAVRILFHHLKCLPRHIHQRRLESFIIKQMILHVALAEQTEQLIDVIDVGGVERCLRRRQFMRVMRATRYHLPDRGRTRPSWDS